MITIISRNILRFLFLVLLQVLLLNNIVLTDFGVTPYFYVIFILLLPFETPGWIMLIFAFSLGLCVDLFSDSFGMHAASVLFMALLRPVILELNSSRDGYEPGTFPRIRYYGFAWFFKYSLILIFCHHLAYFFIEAFSFDNIIITFSKIAINTLFTTVVVVLSQFIIYKD